MRSFIARPALLLSLLLLPVAAYATMFVFAEARCKLWLPEKDWYRSSMREQGSPWLLAVVENDSSTKAISVMATKIPMVVDSAATVESYLRSIYHGLEQSIAGHARITRRGDTLLDGVPARQIVADEMSGGTSYVICAVANHRVYTIIGRWKKGAAETDETLRSVVESFRFIGVPELPSERDLSNRQGLPWKPESK